MPQRRKWPPSILPHAPSGRDRIRVDKIDYWLGPSGSDEARAEYARLVTLLAPKPGEAPSPKRGAWPSVAEAILFWEQHESSRHDPRELKQYRRALKVLLRVCGTESVEAFDCARLEDVRAAMATGSWMDAKDRAYFKKWKRPVDWSAGVCNHQIGRVRTVWRWLERKKKVPKGSWGELRLLPGLDARDKRVRHCKKVRPASAEDVEAICARFRSPTLRAMVRLQWLTGMRSGELRSMKAGEIERCGDSHNGVWLYRPATHKNLWRGQERVIALGPQAQAILAPRLRSTPPTRHVFISAAGTPYTASTYGDAILMAARGAGLSGLRANSLRHGARLRFTREGSLDVARAVMGHTSVTMSAQYASGADLQTAIAAAAKLG